MKKRCEKSEKKKVTNTLAKKKKKKPRIEIRGREEKL